MYLNFVYNFILIFLPDTNPKVFNNKIVFFPYICIILTTGQN
jgi:hypothetical protein